MNRRMFLSIASKAILATTTTAALPLDYFLEKQKLREVWVDPINGKPWPFGDGSQERPLDTVYMGLNLWSGEGFIYTGSTHEDRAKLNPGSEYKGFFL